jgi:AGCS family alanine or glycine:cation symporter
MTPVVDFLNRIIWSPLVGPFPLIAYVLLGVGLYLTVLTRGVQFRLFGHMATTLRSTMQHTDEGVSGFQAFATSLAARVGVGNIVGVATALAIGGPGAIFWMWMVALVGMATSLVESTLAQVYKVNDEGDFRGGPAYYARNGLRSPWFGAVMALLTVLAFVVAFGPIQANAMSTSLQSLAGLAPWVSGVLIAVVAAAVILGGIHRIARFAEVVVPVMAVVYVVMPLPSWCSTSPRCRRRCGRSSPERSGRSSWPGG